MIWGYILGGASIFALIVGLFSIYNGRATRKYIERLIKEENERSREFLERHDKATKESLERITKHLEGHDKATKETMDRISANLGSTSAHLGKMLVRLEEHDSSTKELLGKMSEQHITMMEILKR